MAFGTEVDSCANCVSYRWTQPEDKTTILQCARCKMIFYCSKQCQKEHWEKVHKKHCKFLAEIKVLPMSSHDEANCLVCKEENETDSLLALPCTMSLANMVEMDAVVDTNAVVFPLAEMTGQFQTKSEATVAIMMRLLIKMKLTKHMAWVVDSKIAKELYQTLSNARLRCWTGYLSETPGTRLDQLMSSHLRCSLEKITDQMGEINKLLNSIKFVDASEIRLWDVMRMLGFLLVNILGEVWRNIAECISLPDLSEDLRRIRVTSVQFNNQWQKIVDKLQGGLLPFMNLLEVVCGEHQVCIGCNEEVTVRDVLHLDWMDDPAPPQCPVLQMFCTIYVTFCGKPQCWQKYEKIDEEDDYLIKLYSRLGLESSMDRCDHCGQVYKGVRGHRCSRCLTKVYCGVECRDLDWAIHKLVCREGEEGRKKKEGRMERKQEGGDMFTKWREQNFD